jgi:hypothetical protein
MSRYKDYFQKMVDENKEVFDEFTLLHDKYALDNGTFQKELNLKGVRVLEIIKDYENRLCSNTERGMYIKYSGGLAEKFQEEIRKHYPYIDHIGLIETKGNISNHQKEPFILKKINLN